MDFIPRLQDPTSYILPQYKNQTSSNKTRTTQNFTDSLHNTTQNEASKVDTSYRNQSDLNRNATYSSDMQTMNIVYCAASGYKKTFDDLSKELNILYPTLYVTGSEYPIPASKALLAKLVSFVQYGLYALVFAGQIIFQKLGMAPPAIYTKLTKNKVLAFFFIMTVFNQLNTMLTSTGAFEVTVDNRLVYSKLESGKLPSINDLSDILQYFMPSSPSVNATSVE